MCGGNLSAAMVGWRESATCVSRASRCTLGETRCLGSAIRLDGPSREFSRRRSSSEAYP